MSLTPEEYEKHIKELIERSEAEKQAIRAEYHNEQTAQLANAPTNEASEKSLDLAVKAERLMKDSVEVAAHSLVDLCQNAEQEGTRFRAATYIIDRALGKPIDPENDKIKTLFKSLTKD